MKNKLNWKNLQQNSCPKCGKDLVQDPEFFLNRTIICSVEKCDFRITEQRMKQIIDDRLKKQYFWD